MRGFFPFAVLRVRMTTRNKCELWEGLAARFEKNKGEVRGGIGRGIGGRT